MIRSSACQPSQADPLPANPEGTVDVKSYTTLRDTICGPPVDTQFTASETWAWLIFGRFSTENVLWRARRSGEETF
jgi:hypothetical protein